MVDNLLLSLGVICGSSCLCSNIRIQYSLLQDIKPIGVIPLFGSTVKEGESCLYMTVCVSVNLIPNYTWYGQQTDIWTPAAILSGKKNHTQPEEGGSS